MEAGRSPNIQIITNADLLKVEGEVGRFSAHLRLRPRYVDPTRCTACGLCAQYCPAPIPDRYNENLTTVKALHLEYQQAVPAAFHIDETACLFLTRRECKQCERVCLPKAIDFTQKVQHLTLEVGAVILAPGFGRIDRRVLARYGYGRLPYVITGLELERLTSATGPTQGKILRPADGRHPKRLAFLQCIGSRDTASGNPYCSTVCCMYASKEAAVCLEHDPGLEITIFYMDMRTQGKEFAYARQRARERGVRFIRSRIGTVQEKGEGLEIAYVDQAGRHCREVFDLMVLPEGLESPPDARTLAEACGIALNRYDFCLTQPISPLTTSRPGIFVAGAFQAPKDVPDSVTDATGAAALAAQVLQASQGNRMRGRTYPREIEIPPEPKIGVFVCSCGLNIGSVVDVPAVASYAATLPHVVFTDTNLYSCAQATQEAITEKIQVQGLNRVVVAACSPRTHEPLFQETLRNAGLNACLFEMANIRDHCSWVHYREPEAATAKAKDLVRMAVAKAHELTPLPQPEIPVTPRALIIGGGLAGLTAALTIGGQGFQVYLVEKTPYLGGNLRKLRFLLNDAEPSRLLDDLLSQVKAHPLIDVFTQTEIDHIAGYVGNFTTTLKLPNGSRILEHGGIVLATGGVPYTPTQYLYGQTPNVLTQLEFEELLTASEAPRHLKRLVMIQCVGSRGDDLPYCSKVCCGQAVKNALRLLEVNPQAQITVLYRDMRTYGFMEDAYQEARQRGVLFLPFTPDRPPVVHMSDSGQSLLSRRPSQKPEKDGDGAHPCIGLQTLNSEPETRNYSVLRVTCFNPILQEDLILEPDLVVLSVGLVPAVDEHLVKMLKVPKSRDGFFLEAHPKLKPVELAVAGLFVCGLAHGPKPVPETIAQAQAAAGKAAIPLARGFIKVEPIVAQVDPQACLGCGLCEALCPYGALSLVKSDKKKKAQVISASCKGCGICAAHCPTLAINMGCFTNQQVVAQIRAFGGQP